LYYDVIEKTEIWANKQIVLCGASESARLSSTVARVPLPETRQIRHTWPYLAGDPSSSVTPVRRQARYDARVPTAN
jgi:hypothetical protein